MYGLLGQNKLKKAISRSETLGMNRNSAMISAPASFSWRLSTAENRDFQLTLKATGASAILTRGGNAMAADKRTSVRLSEKLLRKARKTLKASTNEDAVTKALHEILINREIQASLKDLIRKGRGRFVDVYD
jgi:hypothetical protein